MTPTDEELQRFENLPLYLKKIAALLALGLTNKEMAQKMNLHPRTIHIYKHRLIETVLFDTSLKLAVYIVRHPQIEKMLREAL